MDNDTINLKNIFFKIKKLGFNRILVESGITFLNALIKDRLIQNFYLFKSSINLGRSGLNNTSPVYIKKIKFSERHKINVNLEGDALYKVRL